MVQNIVNGLLIGGVYSMVAVGLTIIFGVMKIINFAQGEFLMLGMYMTFYLTTLFKTEGTTPYPYIPIVCIGMFLIGALVFQLTVKHVVGKDASNYIVLTLGIQYFLQYIIQFTIGANFFALPVTPDLQFGSFQIGGMYLGYPRVIAFVTAAIAVIIMTIFLNKTDMGRAMRATSEDLTISSMLGVNTGVIFTVAFALGAVFAGLSGLLTTPMFNIQPRAGTTFGTIGMAVVVLGGLGNIKGALVGGLIIGLVESFASVYINLDMAPVAYNAVLLLVLMLRPQGLFGGGARRA